MRPGGFDGQRRLESIISRGGRHLDIGDNDVRLLSLGELHQLFSVLDYSDDLEAGALQNAHDAGADDWVILANDDSDAVVSDHWAAPRPCRGSGPP